MEVHDIVSEAVINTIPKKKKCKKAKWLFEEALQIAKKRREDRDKGRKSKDWNGYLGWEKTHPNMPPSC